MNSISSCPNEGTFPFVSSSPKVQQEGIVLFDAKEQKLLENQFRVPDVFKTQVLPKSFSVKSRFHRNRKGIEQFPTKIPGYNGSISLYPCIIQNPKHEGKSIVENVDNYHSKFIVAKEFKVPNSDDNYYRYLVFHNVMDFYQFLNEIPESEWNFHECFGSGRRKLFFDIDIKQEEFIKNNQWLLADINSLFTEEYANSVRDDLVKNILGFFLTCGPFVGVNTNKGLNIDSDILVFSSHGKDKFSFHVIIDNYAVENNIQAGEITKKILEGVNHEFIRYIDAGVNKSRQMLRMYLNRKPGTERFKFLNKHWSYFGNPVKLHFNTKGDIRWNVTDFNSEHEKALYKRNLKLDKSLISVFRVEPTKINYKIEPKEPFNRPVYYEEIDDVDLDKIATVLPPGFEIGEFNGSSIRLKRSPGTLCPICNRVHEKDNNTLFIAGPEQKVFLQCFRAKNDPTIMTKLKLLTILKPELMSNVPTDNKPKKKLRADTVYNKSFCNPLPALANFIVLICSYLGTGKTVAFINFIR